MQATSLQQSLERTRAPKAQRTREALLSPYKVKAERCRRSLSYFMQEFWPLVSNDELLWNWHIEYLVKHLEKLAERVSKKQVKEHDLIINIPPGTTKSVTCSIMFPVWCWLKWPWMRIITCSYSSSLSLEHAEHSRDLVRSDLFQALFPELRIKQDKDTKSNFQIQKRKFDSKGRVEQLFNKGNRYSTSVGGTLTGFHAHILIVDDPLDPHRANSEVELQKANRWLEQTLTTRKTDKLVTPTILIMQRLHQDDPTGRTLAKKQRDDVFHICLPGEIRNYAHKVNPPELKEKYTDGLLDTNRMSWDALDNLQSDLGQYGYAGQIGQDPTPPGGGIFKVDYFSLVDVLPNNITQTVRYWDKAGTADGGAYTVGVKMGKLPSGKFIVLDVKRGQWASNERERIIRSTAEADGSDVLVYFEQEPGSGGKESADATIRNLAGYSAYADRPVGDKIYRADPYSVQVNNGNIILMRAIWNRDFIEEHRFFPFGTFKDQVDAGAGAFNKLARKRFVRVI